MSLVVTGTFENEDAAEDAQSYLLSNGFTEGIVELNGDGSHNEIVNIANRTGNVVTLYLQTPREAREGLDVLNNYGAIDVSVPPAA
jgi:hypothetical protein